MVKYVLRMNRCSKYSQRKLYAKTWGALFWLKIKKYSNRNDEKCSRSRGGSKILHRCTSKYRFEWKVKSIPLTCWIGDEGKEYEISFDNKRLGLFTILWGTILPIGVILCDTIFPVGTILFDTVLPSSAILFDAKWYDKEVGWINDFGNIRNEKDLLVDSNDSRCWREVGYGWMLSKILQHQEKLFCEKMKDDQIRK